ncbi:DUF6622 family protein [Marinibaculum pumilum]|uniref:DUF6622 family protein n=1 Tax=Marinibaculum pumilum TaxID=1766165 RepID=A0ABV7KX51_9PROT
MEYVWRILEDTPWWVWVLLVVLVHRGIKALRPTTGPLWRFAIIPVIFLAWGISSLVTDLGLTGLSVGGYLVALIAGIGIGWLMGAGLAVRADREHGLVEVPGGPSTLILILVIFAVKYTIGVWLGMAPAAAGETWFILVDCGVSGLIAGMFAGRFAQYFRKYRSAPQEDLSAAA